MQADIVQQLSKIIEMPIFSIGRASNMLWTGFGVPRVVRDRRGNEKTVGDYAIHIQCSWRIASQSKIIVASQDFYVPSSSWTGGEDDFDWDVQGNTLFDERIQGLFQQDNLPVVKTIGADCYGGFKIVFTNGFVLEAFPNSSNDAENWRMFVPGDAETHFVVSNSGISN